MPTGIYKHKKGYKRPPFSNEWKRKLGLANKGKKRSDDFKKRVSQSLKGIKRSEETKAKIRLYRLGKPLPEHHRQALIGKTSPMKGKKHTLETIKKMKLAAKGRIISKTQRLKISGKNNWNWKGGVTPLNKKIRRSKKFINWRIAVFTRDNYTCQICGQKGGILHPDHIKPFAFFPELRFELSNGRTLCKKCHLQTDSWGQKATTNYGNRRNNI